MIREAVQRMTGNAVFETAYQIKLSCNPAEQTYWSVALDTLKGREEFRRLKFELVADDSTPLGQVAFR